MGNAYDNQIHTYFRAKSKQKQPQNRTFRSTPTRIRHPRPGINDQHTDFAFLPDRFSRPFEGVPTWRVSSGGGASDTICRARHVAHSGHLVGGFSAPSSAAASTLPHLDGGFLAQVVAMWTYDDFKTGV